MQEKFDETSTFERERKLWRASQEYIGGKIELEELDKVEDSYQKVFKKATLTSQNTLYLKNLSSVALFFSIILLIIISFLIYLYTDNQFVLFLLSLLSYPIFKLVKFYFSGREDFENGN